MNTTPEPLAGLIRDHRLIEEAVATARSAITAAAADPADPGVVDRAVDELWLLQSLLEQEVALHIDKEEQVLFPVLRHEVAALAGLVDGMVAEHDLIKEKRDLLGRTLAELDDDHSAVREATLQLRDGLTKIENGNAASVLAGLRETVEQLDWVFQGHFTGEEDGLFLPAEDLLSAETLAEMTRLMALLEARGGRSTASHGGAESD